MQKRVIQSAEYFLKHLAATPRSALVGLAYSTGLVAFCFVLVIGMQREGLLAFYILLPGVFAAAVLFSCGSGIYAAALSTLLLYEGSAPAGARSPHQEQ